MAPGEIAAIILAAGKSTRFGSNKLLTEVDFKGVKQALLLHTLSPWLDVFEYVYLVTPKDDLLIKQVCHSIRHRLKFIKAEQSESGMGHSLAAGVSECQQSKGYLIGLADMPMIEPVVLERLINNLKQGFFLSAPYFNGKRGHPVAFSKLYESALLASSGDTGAKTILLENEAIIERVEVASPSVLIDIDVETDLSVLTKDQCSLYS